MDSRSHVTEVFPEIELIEATDLQEKVIDAWTVSLEDGEFGSLKKIPGQPMLGSDEIDNVAHTRGVTELARAMASVFNSMPGYALDMDVVTAGALCHDIGKAFEFKDLENGSYIGVAWESSGPTIRHPVVGAGIGWAVELPWEVIHVIATHSMEGEHVIRSQESNIVHHADYAWWGIVLKEEFNGSFEEIVRQD